MPVHSIDPPRGRVGGTAPPTGYAVQAVASCPALRHVCSPGFPAWRALSTNSIDFVEHTVHRPKRQPRRMNRDVSPRTPRRVVVIGAGAAGTLTAIHLLRAAAA